VKKKIKIYVYPKCSTCKNALRFLERAALEYEVTDISKTPPNVAELQRMLDYQTGDIKKLFNTSGIQYRERNIKEKLPGMSKEQALKLLSVNGMLIKRPFLLASDFGLLGFRELQWQEKFGG
jgi:arsenate reductase